MTARISSELRILYSLPSSLISVPPYLLTRTRSPFVTSKGTFFPLSSVLPVPRATTGLSIGFSLAESGMIIPPFFVSFSSTGSTRTRSPRGLTFTAIIQFRFRLLLMLSKIPLHSRREKLPSLGGRARSRANQMLLKRIDAKLESIKGARTQQRQVTFLSEDHFVN